MHTSNQPSQLLVDQLEQFRQLPSGPILDLACGSGRNGLALAQAGHPLWFTDANKEALARVEHQLTALGTTAVIWHQDLEDGHNPFAGKQFAAVIGFNYLHRELFPWLIDAVKPGGLVIYETFTIKQAEIGRPSNPAFLLKPNELKQFFASWQILHYVEGKQANPDRYSAQLVARKPNKE
ncbi:class I SAM-dependent methyltransferase [Ferrimonas lipolytica]|uniref:Class I SAM-dependent methyltransferase n=1 Tax=Ferrimonas lipolytica TaxID=2724191 RepID=A0A6H1U8T0_9GAMM|nr:class I SAM-dependent methyltransferase [Ferrimonas lipolytica]QIZ75451.1 class I SAM-dependent methyltransferase [Ferrimonas lipolytica]